MRAVLIIAALALAGCGVDGPPVRPADAPAKRFDQQGRVTISGDARIGVMAEL